MGYEDQISQLSKQTVQTLSALLNVVGVTEEEQKAKFLELNADVRSLFTQTVAKAQATKAGLEQSVEDLSTDITTTTKHLGEEQGRTEVGVGWLRLCGSWKRRQLVNPLFSFLLQLAVIDAEEGLSLRVRVAKIQAVLESLSGRRTARVEVRELRV